MILSKHDIETAVINGRIKVFDWDGKPVKNPSISVNSIDVHLGRNAMRVEKNFYDTNVGKMVQCPAHAPKLTPVDTYSDRNGTYFILHAGECILAVTEERIDTLDFYPKMEGRSSIGRLFVSPHFTAGSGDVGFCGYWELELTAMMDTKMYYGMPIGQITFAEVTNPNDRYKGTYQHSDKSIKGSNLFKKYFKNGSDATNL